MNPIILMNLMKKMHKGLIMNQDQLLKMATFQMVAPWMTAGWMAAPKRAPDWKLSFSPGSLDKKRLWQCMHQLWGRSVS